MILPTVTDEFGNRNNLLVVAVKGQPGASEKAEEDIRINHVKEDYLPEEFV